MGAFDQHFTFCKLSNESIVRIKFDDTIFPHYFLKMFEKTDCFLLLYNIADKKSFEKCSYLKEIVISKCENCKNVILIGNKKDMIRDVSFEEGENFAKSNNYPFFEVSCAQNENIVEAMEMAIDLSLKNKKINKDEEPLKQEKSKKKNCIAQ